MKFNKHCGFIYLIYSLKRFSSIFVEKNFRNSDECMYNLMKMYRYTNYNKNI